MVIIPGVTSVYEEDDRGIDVLKSVLPVMSRHAAGYHPISYTVWYEYASGKQPALKTAIDDELKIRDRLTVALTYSYYTKYLVEPAEAALRAARTGLMEVVEKVQESVRKADEDTAGFDEHLSKFQQSLQGAKTVAELGAPVSSMLVETRRVTQSLGQLTVRLDQSRTEVHRLTSELHHAREEAHTDKLSGLLNRRGFDRELEQLGAKADAPIGVLTAIMLDIDHFKKINDTYGHPLGDVVISVVGRFIRECVEQMGIAARYGGEEFAVLLPAHPLETAEKLAQAICDRVAQGKIKRRKGDEPIGGLTISAGVAALREGEDLASLIERADKALYASKAAGRNRVTVDKT